MQVLYESFKIVSFFLKQSVSLTADVDAFEESSSSPIDSVLRRCGALVAVTCLGTTFEISRAV
jgi:hypothetical protein